MMEYKELQSLMKAVAWKAMLDREFRELCLKDSQAAVRALTGQDAEILRHIVFTDEDVVCPADGSFTFTLPPYVKKSWLLARGGED